MLDVEAQRQAVVAEARSWLRTPYHHMGRVKGAGVDCATLLAEVYTRAGIVPAVEIPYYPPDWHLHQNAERYLNFILAHATEVFPGVAQGEAESRPSPSCEAKPKPADVALWRFGKCFSHGAIVVEWPLVIHAYSGKGCILEDAERAVWLSRLSGKARGEARPVRFFTLKKWAEAAPAKPRVKVTLAPELQSQGVR
jgi:cell wall-associated NlpC family hydrolase